MTRALFVLILAMGTAAAQQPDPPDTVLPVVRPGTTYMPVPGTVSTIPNIIVAPLKIFVCSDGYVPVEVGAGAGKAKFMCISADLLKEGEWKSSTA